MPKEGLTDKRRAFVDAYCSNGFNASQAYKTAYPKCKAGYQQAGSRMLLDVVINQAIEDKKAEMAEKTEVDLAWLTQQRLNAIAKAQEIGNLKALHLHLQALEKHKGYYEEDNRQAQAQAQAAAEMSPDEAIAYHLRCLNRLKAVREAPDARSTG